MRPLPSRVCAWHPSIIARDESVCNEKATPKVPARDPWAPLQLVPEWNCAISSNVYADTPGTIIWARMRARSSPVSQFILVTIVDEKRPKSRNN